MSPKEFLALHEKAIYAVEAKCRERGLSCKVVDKVKQPSFRETWFVIDSEVYSLFNDGNQTDYKYLGLHRD